MTVAPTPGPLVRGSDQKRAPAKPAVTERKRRRRRREADETWTDWHTCDHYGRKRISRQIDLEDVKDLEDAWHFARELGMPLNRFITVRAPGIDDLTPEERQKHYQKILNKLGQFARDRGFTAVYVWGRETNDQLGRGEHLHVIMWVPEAEKLRFNRVVRGWGTSKYEVKVEAADYERRRRGGKIMTMIGYVTKACSQNQGSSRPYRRGGPILGARTGMTRNLLEDERIRRRGEIAREEFARQDELADLHFVIQQKEPQKSEQHGQVPDLGRIDPG